MNERTELKRCPWCKDEAHITYPDDKTVKISCGRTNCLSFVAVCDDVDDLRITSELVDKWNEYAGYEEER